MNKIFKKIRRLSGCTLSLMVIVMMLIIADTIAIGLNDMRAQTIQICLFVTFILFSISIFMSVLISMTPGTNKHRRLAK